MWKEKEREQQQRLPQPKERSGAQPAVLSMAGDGPSSDDIIKILITSDNHVGYNEKDEIRGGDSFHTFEEVLKIAADEKVRMPPRSCRGYPR